MGRLLNPPLFFFILALLSGLPLVFFTPPFQVADEPAHFYRAYAISEGQIVAVNQQGKTGGQLPSSLDRFVQISPADKKYDRQFFSTAFQIQLDRSERSFLSFPTTAVYSPIPYRPQSIGILVGRMAGARPIFLLYLGRTANLLATAALIYFALSQLPTLRWFAAVLALAPMAVFLRSSLSADAVTFAVALLLSATVAKLAFSTNYGPQRSDMVVLIICSAALCLTKPAFAPLVLSGAAIPPARLARRNRAAVVGGLLVVCLCAFTVAVLFAAHVDSPLREGVGVDSQAQIRAAIHNPFRFFQLMALDYLTNSPRYAAEFIGRLGWLDVPLPAPFLFGYLFLLLALIFIDTDQDVHATPRQRIVVGAAALLTVIVISASQYALWTPLGASRIEGAQGRHFYPAVPFAVWILYTKRFAARVSNRSLAAITGASILLSVVVTFIALYHRYYVSQ